jgi:hypothetical protein
MSVFRTALFVLPFALAAGAARADQPAMEAAIRNIDQALEALQRATSDKGGHRANAAKLLREARKEVQAGIEYDRANVSKKEADVKAAK